MNKQGIGLGAVVSGATIITDKMLYAASEAVAASLTEEERAEGRVFPRVARIRQVSLKVATEVAKVSTLAPPLYEGVEYHVNSPREMNPISPWRLFPSTLPPLPPSLPPSLSRPPSWRS